MSILVMVSITDVEGIIRSIESNLGNANQENVATKNNASNAPAMMPICPDDIEADLAAGECGALVDFDFGDLSVTPDVSRLLVPVNDTTMINGSTFCAQGPTSYRRTFRNLDSTNLVITRAKIGVFESANSPVVTINYRDFSTNAIIYQQVMTAPAMIRRIWNVNLTTPVIIPAGRQFVMEVIANIPLVSVFKMGLTTSPSTSGFGIGTITAPDCIGTPLDVNIALGTVGSPSSVVMGYSGVLEDYRIVNRSAGELADLNSGDLFPAGTNTMQYTIYQSNGAITNCTFDVVVNEFEDAVSSLACHNLVNVSLQDNCQVEITSQMILQGDEYGCYDDYEVEVFNTNGTSLGNIVTEAQLGRKLKVTITSPDGNSCWGEIKVEDKYAPSLECEDVYTTCSNSLIPGSLMNERLSITSVILMPQITDNGSRLVRFDTVHLEGSTVTDVNVRLRINHPSLDELSAVLIAPDGTSVPLFMDLECGGDKIDVEIDDESINDTPVCDIVGDNVTGSFKPVIPLDILDGKDLSGVWSIRVFDNSLTNVGTIESADIIFEQDGGRIPFPTTEEITWTFADPGNLNVFIVEGLDPCGPVELSYSDDIVDQPCSSEYAQIITRCWSGVDESGNNVEPCCQTIYVIRNGLSTLVWPPNFDGTPGNKPALSCEDFGDEVPGVEITGEPTGDFCSNVQLADPEDVIIDICPSSYKILRTHKIIEWCTGTILTHLQIIKVADEEGPEVEAIRDTTINTTSFDCSGTYIAPRPTLIFDCSGIQTMELSHAYINDDDEESPLDFTTLGVNQAQRRISELPIGESIVRWELTDSCGNQSSVEWIVTVEDKIAPNVVCDQFTKASITGTNGGKAIVEAYTFDDGSNDNCGIFKYEVRRRFPRPECGLVGGDSAPFRETVEFCCVEVGTQVMVELRVTDVHNNSNTCMVTVTVEDKLPPFITKCPKDITLLCQDDYLNYDITGRPEAVDNCEVVSIEPKDVVNINQCGIGTVTRTWTATDKQGLRHSCVQVITLIDERPFNPNTDITWPQDYTTNMCSGTLHPDSLPIANARPRVNDDNCSLVGMHYKDTQFDVVEDACVKILREWTIIDWCTYNENNPSAGGLYTRIQVLKIQDLQKPDIDGDCEDRIIPSYGACRDSVIIVMSGTDQCPEALEHLEWKYELFNDGDLFPFETRKRHQLRTLLADGKYRIRWTLEDKCGNVDVCTFNFEVKDLKNPTPICHSTISTAVMGTDGTVEIWAKDFDKGSFDNCTPTNRLQFTFNQVKPFASLLNSVHYVNDLGNLSTPAQYLLGNVQKWDPVTRSMGMVFTCEDLIGGISYDLPVEMTVIDSVGNLDYCTVTLRLEDHLGACPDQNIPFANVSGKVVNATNNPLANTNVKLEGLTPDHNKYTSTTANGTYTISQVVPNRNYTLSLENNQDVLNGVSTLDLVMIQRHILGITPFTSPYKVIAADGDNNEKVTASDLVALRKLILGINSEFSNGQKSYRFVAKDHEFASTANPFPFTEKYEYTNISGQITGQDFIPVKIGDVNDSATYGAKDDNTGSRSVANANLYTDNVSIANGEEFKIPVYMTSEKHVVGLQGTMTFDANAVKITGVSSGSFAVSESNFGFQAIEEGKLTFSIHDVNASKTNANQPIFYVHVQTNEEANISNLLNLASTITPASAFDSDNQVVNLVWRNVGVNEVTLGQNTPNPFNATTQIDFTLAVAGDATLTITDIHGKVIKQWNQHYTAGEHHVNLTKNDLPSSGVYMYHLTTNGQKLSKKMILIDQN
jgi:subtilisin-like proprotein convertase family protein